MEALNNRCFLQLIATRASLLQNQTFRMILHHYPNSPFAEKIRAIFGYKGIAWQSCPAPDIMPKPDLQALTGGYRRIPVLQIGADVYCDTSLICKVVDAAQPAPSLYGTANAGLVDTLAQWADDKLFWAAMGYNFKGAAALFANRPPEQAAAAAQAFATDRAAMFGAAARLRPSDATVAYADALRRIASILGTQDFLFGSAPTLADFACYHPLWFTQTRVPQMAGIFDATPALKPWLARMAAIGHVHNTAITAEAARTIALNTEPASVRASDASTLAALGVSVGDEVSVTAQSFGPEATVGELVCAQPNQYTLRRQHPQLGTVHTHFPALDFVIKKAV